MRFLLALLLCLPMFAQTYTRSGPKFDPDMKWTTTDTLFEAAVVAGFAVDYATSNDGIYRYQHGEPFQEDNPIQGKHPSKTTNLIYNLAWTVGHVYVASKLPPPWRRVWQLVFIAAEYSAVNKNMSIGLKMRW